MGRYVLTWVALLVLTTGTLLLSFVVRGDWDVAVALLFAVAKGSFVVWIFMHLSHEPAASRISFVTGLALVVLVISLVIGDVAMRLPLSVELPPTR